MKSMKATAPNQSPNFSLDLPYGKNYLDAGGVERRTSSCLTFSRGWLQHVARETYEIAEQGYYVNTKGESVSIKEDLQKALDGSLHYHSTHVFEAPASPGPFKTQVIIARASSLQAATQLQDQKVTIGVLNSASAKTPNKFLRGTVSQEECICRASLLSKCLSKYDHIPHHFYYINNKEKYQQNASACAIYSPNVPIIRQDTVRGELLDRYELASFVSIPAANAFVVGRQEHEHNIPKAQSIGAAEAGVPHENMTLRDAMYDRIFRAICILQTNGCQALVLCAYGCGVHGNNPETVAKIFREILMETNMRGHFQTVVFAIQPSRTGNYKAFQKVFPEATAL